MQEITQAITDLKSNLTDKIAAIQTRLDANESFTLDVAQKMASDPSFGAISTRRISVNQTGQALTKSDSLRDFVGNRSIKTAGVQLPGLLKSLVVGDGSAGNDSIGVPANFDPRLGEGGQRKLSIFDILPTLPVNSNSFEFNRLDGYVNAADYQANEGAAKAAAEMPTELVTATIATIAHVLPLSEQVLADMPALSNQVTTLMRYGVQHKASAELIAGATAGKVQGLATQAAEFVADAGTSLPDAIAGAVSALEQSGWQASAVLMNPSDWLAIRTMREGTGTGQYLYGSPANATAETLWGLPVVTDPAVTGGAPIVLDASQVAILDRQQAMVDFGRIDSDFSNNVIRCRAECRIGLAVFSPSAVLNVTIAA